LIGEIRYLSVMNFLRRILKGFLFGLSAIVVLLLIFLAFSIAPIDKTSIQEFSAYGRMMSRLDSIGHIQIQKPVHQFHVGYSKVNLVPPFKTATAGYGKRRGKPYTSIRDSLFVRAILIDNGTQRVAIVSADLLIIPPAVTEVLKSKLPEIGFSLDNTFLGATHSHNSIGNWGPGATQFLYGNYKEEVVNFIADAIVNSIREASQHVLPASMKSGQINIPGPVENRLIDNGPEDASLRMITFQQNDGTKLLLMNYTAHATCLYSKDFSLSRDYPGELVDTMESSYCDFAMFMAGAVGSHGCDAPVSGEDCIGWMAKQISDEIIHNPQSLLPVRDSVIAMLRVPLELANPQIKLNETWKVRSWLFKAAVGESPAFLTCLRIGDIVLLGTPCDFSGEFDHDLDSIAAQNNLKMMVTSFNGGYIGYVTPLKYYDFDHYETRLMNWYPPGNGEYISLCLQKLLEASATAH
jgi:neutral ceramidase